MYENRGRDEGFADGESPEDDDAMDTNVTVDDEDEVLEGAKGNTVYYAAPISANEFDSQGKNYTKAEVDYLMNSEPYQRKIDTCHLCGRCWYDDQFSADCVECGNHAMTRPCPVCNGQCNTIWKREVKTSHAFHEAHWEGECGLPEDVRNAYMLRYMTDSSEDTLTEGMQDLSTS